MEGKQNDSWLDSRPFGGWTLRVHLYLLSFLAGLTLVFIGIYIWVNVGFSYACLKYFAGIFLVAWPLEDIYKSAQREAKRSRERKKFNEVFDTPEKKLEGKKDKTEKLKGIAAYSFAISLFITILGVPFLIAGLILEPKYGEHNIFKMLGLMILAFPAYFIIFIFVSEVYKARK